MDRRRFLAVTGATAASLLAGCGGGGGGDHAPPLSSGNPPGNPGGNPSNPNNPPPTNPPPTAPTSTDWQTLASRLDGNLVRPDSAGYEQVRVAFNSRYDGNRPQAVVQCATPDDVSEVMGFVRRYDLPVTARSGGHSYAGYSTGSGIIIDVGPMNAIQLNGTIATIGAGAKLADVYDYLAARGVSIPSGNCLSVGIAGITLGGGMSIVSRTYGLTCDRLVSARIVTADGRQIECSASQEPDLFWALRGGGGGNFGIVTSLSFQTHAVGNLTRFYASFRFEDAAHVLNEWMSWTQGLPDRIWSTAVFEINGSSGDILFAVSGFCNGNQTDLQPYWNNFINAAPRQPDVQNMYTQPYRDMLMDYCYGMTLSECHLPPQTPDARLTRHAMAASSDMFSTAIPAAGVQALVQAVQQRVASDRSGIVKIDLLGGAINRIASDASAYVHRDILFDAQYYAYFDARTPADAVDEAGRWATGMRSVMQPWSTGRAYQNYIDPRIQDWQAAFYGSNYSRLARVKAQYDPDWVFRFAQGIQPAG